MTHYIGPVSSAVLILSIIIGIGATILVAEIMSGRNGQ